MGALAYHFLANTGQAVENDGAGAALDVVVGVLNCVEQS